MSETRAVGTTYRLSWDSINLDEMWRYSNADPRFYAGTIQTVPNSLIPDEHWHRVEKVDGDPWDQHSTLKQWADSDFGFVRNVLLEEAEIVDPQWREWRAS